MIDKNPVSTVTWNQSIYIDNNQGVTVSSFFFLFFLGTPSPYNWHFVGAPTTYQLSGLGSLIPYNFRTLGVPPLRTSVLGS
jgi:hypothetical protein